jgi:alpha-beta hydrolase superfamily lysophospholipase
MGRPDDVSMTERFEVQVWESSDRPVGRVLLLPGGAYTVDNPLLYWACQVAAGAGWQVSTMRWSIDEVARRDPLRFVEEGADLIDSIAPPAPSTVVIAKSFGTRSVLWANARGYAGVWLTPLLTDHRVQAALTVAGPPALSIGGTADRLWDRAAAARLRGTVIEIDGADHSLHVGSDWRTSLTALDRTLAGIEGHLDAQNDESGR